MHVCRPPQDNPKTLNTQLYIQLFEKKLARFEQFARLYPECYWIFVGDNGQVRSAATPAAAMGPQQSFCNLLVSHDRGLCCAFWAENSAVLVCFPK